MMTTQTNTETTYNIVDSKTKEIVGRYSNKKRARNKAEKLNQEYGCYKYSVIVVEGLK